MVARPVVVEEAVRTKHTLRAEWVCYEVRRGKKLLGWVAPVYHNRTKKWHVSKRRPKRGTRYVDEKQFCAGPFRAALTWILSEKSK